MHLLRPNRADNCTATSPIDRHIDGLVVDEKHKEIFLLEEKSLCSFDQVARISKDSKIIQEAINDHDINWKKMIANFQPSYKFYVLLLGDTWPEKVGTRKSVFDKWVAESLFDTSNWVGGPGEYISNKTNLKPIKALDQDYFLLCYCWPMGEKAKA